jgi:broad specificity phosphatase PhoE
MTTFLLARHAASELMHEIYVGRRLDPPLTQEGETQARALAERLRPDRIDVGQSSPRRRAQQTAHEILERRGLALETEAALDEIDVGDWGGKRFAELARDPAWTLWNSARHLHRPPGGEAMLDVQQRIVSHLLEMRCRHPQGVVLLVTHAEVIRCALLHCLGVPVVAYASIEVYPAAVARIQVDDHGCTVLAMNEQEACAA